MCVCVDVCGKGECMCMGVCECVLHHLCVCGCACVCVFACVDVLMSGVTLLPMLHHLCVCVSVFANVAVGVWMHHAAANAPPLWVCIYAYACIFGCITLLPVLAAHSSLPQVSELVHGGIKTKWIAIKAKRITKTT